MPSILLLTTPLPRNPRYGFSLGEIRPPLGIGYLISSLEAHNIDVDFADLYAGASMPSDLQYDFIGVQVNSACYDEFVSLIFLIKDRGFAGKIVVGGPHATILPNSIPETVDYVVVGEAEWVLPDIIKNAPTERVIHAPRIDDIDTLPRVDYSRFDQSLYTRTFGEDVGSSNVYVYSSSRGCPYKCRFCSTKAMYGRKWVAHSAKRVVDDIEYLISDFHADGIYFREDNFTVDETRVIDICNMLLDRNISINWKCETRINLDFSVLKLMAQAGCKIVYAGIESGSQRMLDIYNKDIKIWQIRRFVEECKRLGIKIYGSFIKETPHEKPKDYKLTRKLIRELDFDRVSVAKYIAMPGSEFYDEILENPDLIDKHNIQVIYGE